MHRRAFALVAVLLSACGYTLRAPPSAPVEPLERQRAEAAACARGTFPYWLDEDAVKAALDVDRREAQASTTNESFHGATYTAQPPAPARGGSRAPALLEERDRFQRWCEERKRLQRPQGP